jgi:hypothetical protein
MRLRARSETEFVYLPKDARIAFQVDEHGSVQGLSFARGERTMEARKVE